MTGKYWQTGFGELYRSLSKSAFVEALQVLLPEIKTSDLIPGGSGVRAQAVSASGGLIDDFVIKQSHNTIHVLNARFLHEQNQNTTVHGLFRVVSGLFRLPEFCRRKQRHDGDPQGAQIG